MKKRFLVAAAVAAIALSMFPALANDPVEDLAGVTNRYAPQPAGTRQDLRFVFGPYSVPAGVDRNQITVDLPLSTGFATRVFPNLINLADGKEFTEQQAHIHHAHWFRVTADGKYEMYSPGLSWVFGTGEERTGGSLRDRESSTEDWTYGIESIGTTPQALIFMIHNKTAKAINAYITLDVEFTWGTRAEIKEKDGKDIHPLRGVLTGTTQDAIVDTAGQTTNNGVLAKEYKADFSGTLIASASHMHPGGEWVYVTNLGPRVGKRFVCGDTENANDVTDVDEDGLPGTTLFVSKKIDAVKAAWPYSEEYQMGGTQGGFRAPIHLNDVIKQYGVYDGNRSMGSSGWPKGLFKSDPLDKLSPVNYASKDGGTHAWYEAMSYTGLYSDDDVLAKPALAGGITESSQCTPENFAPKLVPSRGFNSSDHPEFLNDPRATYETRSDWGIADDHCGVPEWGDCEDGTDPAYVEGDVVSAIHVANFEYVWGDQKLGAPFNILPQLKLGTKVQLVNEDIGLASVRHTFTSCKWPCDGAYVANYPLPDGRFDSGKLGNLDYVDGGLVGDDTVPLYNLVVDPVRFTAGTNYSYYCSIHPWMRGAFKVVA